MYTRLIVPIDDSPLATRALPYALALAHAFGAKITLLQVVEPVTRAQCGYSDEEMLRDARAHLVQVRQAVINPAHTLHLQPDGVTCRVAYGERNASLVRTIAEEQADMVVMTTHGRAGIPLLALGSVASYVVRHAGVPVLLIRPATGAVSAPIESLLSNRIAVSRERPILVPLDGTPEAEAILDSAISLAKAIGAPIALLQVLPLLTPLSAMGMAAMPLPDLPTVAELCQSADVYLRQMQAYVRSQGVSCSYKVETGNIVEQITDCAGLLDAQYIVMMTRKHNLFARFVLGSTADGVIRHSHVPVLTLYPQAEMETNGSVRDALETHV